MGKSFLGGWSRGTTTGSVRTGDAQRLELSTPFQWELAQRDILIARRRFGRYYGDGLVWPFVIVGTHPYANFLRQIVNENGSDGTVRVGRQLNARGVTIDFGKMIRTN